MTEQTAEEVREKVDAVYRSESRRIFATLSLRLIRESKQRRQFHRANESAVQPSHNYIPR